jgi:hypothetical protein
MFDLTQLIGHWGYLAIFVLVILGNVGVDGLKPTFRHLPIASHAPVFTIFSKAHPIKSETL